MKTKHLLFTFIALFVTLVLNAQANDNKLLIGTWIFEKVDASVTCNRSNVKKLIEKKLIEDYMADVNTAKMSVVFKSDGTFQYLDGKEVIEVGKYAYNASKNECRMESNGELDIVSLVINEGMLMLKSPDDLSSDYTPETLEKYFNLENASRVKVEAAYVIIILKRLK